MLIINQGGREKCLTKEEQEQLLAMLASVQGQEQAVSYQCNIKQQVYIQFAYGLLQRYRSKIPVPSHNQLWTILTKRIILVQSISLINLLDSFRCSQSQSARLRLINQSMTVLLMAIVAVQWLRMGAKSYTIKKPNEAGNTSLQGYKIDFCSTDKNTQGERNIILRILGPKSHDKTEAGEMMHGLLMQACILSDFNLTVTKGDGQNKYKQVQFILKPLLSVTFQNCELPSDFHAYKNGDQITWFEGKLLLEGSSLLSLAEGKSILEYVSRHPGGLLQKKTFMRRIVDKLRQKSKNKGMIYSGLDPDRLLIKQTENQQEWQLYINCSLHRQALLTSKDIENKLTQGIFSYKHATLRTISVANSWSFGLIALYLLFPGSSLTRFINELKQTNSRQQQLFLIERSLKWLSDEDLSDNIVESFIRDCLRKEQQVFQGHKQ